MAIVGYFFLHELLPAQVFEAVVTVEGAKGGGFHYSRYNRGYPSAGDVLAQSRPMVQLQPKLLTVRDFIDHYGDNPQYELIDGELADIEPTGPA